MVSTSLPVYNCTDFMTLSTKSQWSFSLYTPKVYLKWMISHSKNVDRTFFSANGHQLLHSLKTLLLLLQNILPKPSYSVPPFKQLSHLPNLTTRGTSGLLLWSLVVPISHPVQTHISSNCACLFNPTISFSTLFSHNNISTLQLLCSTSYISLLIPPKLLCSSPLLTPLLTLTALWLLFQ